MNNIITNYAFNATAKTITLSDFTLIDVKRVRFIKNLSTNSFIYKFTDALSISSATNVITFTGSNTGMVNSNQLAIQYDTVNGSVAAAGALSIALPIEQVQDFILTGQAGQSAVGQNILLSTAGTTGFDTLNPSTGVSYRSWYVQVIPSAAVTGVLTFEGSNDNITFNQMPFIDEANNNGLLSNATSLLSSGNRYYSGKCSFRFIRARISTVIGGGTIQAITKFSQETYVPRITTIGTSISVINSVASGGLTADLASSVISTTTTTAGITQGNALSYSVSVTVSAVSGTLPTLDINIEESDDTGVNWFIVHSFPRITAIGNYRSPRLLMNGNQRRYTQVVGGTTPSFTRSIFRIQYQDSIPMVRQLIDRSIVLTTLNSVTPSLLVNNTKNVQLIVIIDTTTTAPILQLEGSDDNGANWYSIGTALTAVASGTAQLTVPNMSSQFIRARVSTAGTATLLNSVILKGF